MRTLLRWIGKYISFSEAVYFLLIFLVMHSVLLGIELVIRGTSLEVLQLPILLGILAGWLLSRSGLKFWQAALIAVLGGLIVVVLHVSGVGAAAFVLLKSSLGYLLRLIFRRPLNTAQLTIELSVIEARTSEGLISLGLWGRDFLSGFMIYNQISTLLSWSFILWIMACWFAWTTYRRHQPLWGVLLSGTMLAILMTYTLEKRFTLVLLLGAGLSLIGMVNHDLKQQEWKEKGFPGKDVVRERVYLAILAFSIYTMAFSGLMPSIRISPIADRFERLVYGSGEDAEGGDGGAEIEVGGFSSELYSIERFAGLPRQKLIGSGPELARRVVMVVSYPTIAFVESDLPNAARYWRSYSYDQYTGSGWQSSPTQEISYQPGQEISGVYSESTEIITQEFRLTNAVRGTLFSAGPPVTLDHEVQVSWRTLQEDDSPGGDQFENLQDIFAVTLDTILYQVRSLVSRASDDELRTSSDIYPEWVSTRYLQLPDSIPQRVFDLGQDITANQPTGYDQAKAIESFLRSYPYDLNLPAPPTDRDVVDYFLFDLQTGYCDYYATAMVVLARSVGLPARAVVGYVGGQYDQENDYYVVTEADAHTWVEVYFTDFGWVPFEPTAARSLIGDENLALPLPPELENLPQQVEAEEKSEFPWLQVGAALGLLVGFGLWLGNRADLIRLRSMDSNSLILLIYQRLFRYGRWIEIGHQKSDTLYEFNQKMLQVFQNREEIFRKRRYSGGAKQINQLTDYAVKANFSNHQLDKRLNEKIVDLWISLRTKLRRLVWRRFWNAQLERLAFWKDSADDINKIKDGAADGTR